MMHFRYMARSLARMAVAAAALLLAPMALQAQNATTNGQIRGTVAGPAGQPVQGVALTAVNEGTGLTRSTLTGENGRYMLHLLPPGSYTVRAEVIGYRTDEVPGVQVAIGQTSTANFEPGGGGRGARGDPGRGGP